MILLPMLFPVIFSYTSIIKFITINNIFSNKIFNNIIFFLQSAPFIIYYKTYNKKITYKNKLNQ